GTGTLTSAFGALGTELRNCSYSRFRQRCGPLERASLRIGQAFTRVFDYPSPERMTRLGLDLGPGRDFELRQLVRWHAVIEADTTLAWDQRLAVCMGLVDDLLANGDQDRAVRAMTVAAQIALVSDRAAEHRVLVKTALDMARRARDYPIVCQILG